MVSAGVSRGMEDASQISTIRQYRRVESGEFERYHQLHGRPNRDS
jgi:hypothetical protein